MNTNNESREHEQSGQTIFTEYTKWAKGRHFISAKQTLPNSKETILIGRIYLELDENKKATYLSKDDKGNELFPPSKNLIELKKQFKAQGKELEEIHKHFNTPEVKKEEPKEQKQEVANARDRKESQSKDNQINR